MIKYFSKNVKGRNIFYTILLSVGMGVSLYLTFGNNPSLYLQIAPLISIPLGLICVILLGLGSNYGNIFGIIANINEIVVNISFGNFGYVISTIYFMISHVFGFFNWKKHENNGSVEMRTDVKSKTSLYSLIGFLVLGTVFVLLNYHFGWLGVANLSSPLFWLNIAIMYIGIIAQGTMMLRFKYSWLLWISANIVSIPLQFMSGNYVFVVLYSLYLINALMAYFGERL